MSNSESEDIKDYIDWLEKSISEEHIRYYDYEEFNNAQPIGKGSYGSVIRVTWKNTNRIFALKSFLNNDKTTLKEVVNEV